MLGKEISFEAVPKTVSVGAEVTSGGRLSQKQLPATDNARSLIADWTTVYDGSLAAMIDDDRRRRRLESTTHVRMY